ncbi:2-C-methyl-D-erythritol 4-phosphate cytidylyltransferase [Francisella halioticida]|uniref:2-C-methyl-D-erythritol 4-phosphate cytidylyltransferase n=1 Tax=Francisella halioticida TaxID=549298 RepID=A0ABM6M0L1_9GAMM|nr:2-C-methyl-D-erythritol 4-phosphate cytidylyltransferase [Francisella halioticida]ASG68480.1 2-C-methyl-D-erythritol 4-phosphate cytidylyltransferase [Francisella halioticida]BCD91367.1 2-C-methyl-D-erythritol 4-phosphate cytidylyltransferase [Francisella halioticida]
MSNKYVIIPAAGIGTRMQLDIPKQYYKLSNDKTILDNTLEKFIDNPLFDYIIISLNSQDEFWDQSIYYDHPKVDTCIGGATRFESVYNALRFIRGNSNDWIFVHDAARPCVDTENIIALYELTKTSHSQAGILAVKAFETVKKIATKNIVVKTIDRNDIWLAQTPQLSRLGQLEKSFDFCYSNNLINKITDEASALELYGINPIVIEGGRRNIKITTQDDLDIVNWQLSK